jgi:hypothetical protein
MNRDKENLLTALRAFINQRAGLEFGNYRTGNHAESARLYRSEQRSITTDRHDAETLLNAVAWRDSITADNIVRASKRAFSGRLSLERGRVVKGKFEPGKGDSFRVNYCTGQYFPTEYRKAVCAVLAQALWDYWRAEYCDGRPEAEQISPRIVAHKELPRSVAARWFN